jgi:hypothetical protein
MQLSALLFDQVLCSTKFDQGVWSYASYVLVHVAGMKAW